jgi:Tfp pilus assembly pilus retraction ATPase PilT
MIDKINRERHEHIVTVEDPIEFVHDHKGCIVNPARGVLRHPQLRAVAEARPPAGSGHRADR